MIGGARAPLGVHVAATKLVVARLLSPFFRHRRRTHDTQRNHDRVRATNGKYRRDRVVVSDDVVIALSLLDVVVVVVVVVVVRRDDRELIK